MAKLIRRTLPFGQILLILIGVMVLYLAADLSHLVGVSYRRRKELQQIEGQLAAARARQAELQDRLTYAQSEAAVEEWARDNGLSRRDEVPVVIVAPAADGAMPPGQQPTEVANPETVRGAWWNLFFGSRTGW